ncbi:MAG: CsgG/HfaB family protein [Planctomycetota bacterium]
MNPPRLSLLSICLLLYTATTPGFAQTTPPPPPPTATPTPATQPTDARITLSVMPFAVPEGEEQAGIDLAEVLSLLLADAPGYRVVERRELDRLIAEQGLNLTGLVETADAVKIGRLVGAKVMVVGRVFELGQSRMMTVKLIGTETSLISGVVERAGIDQPLDGMILPLSAKIAEKLTSEGDRLLAAPTPPDPLPGLIAKLKGRDLPVIAVFVREEDARTADIPDPAIETEIKRQLIAAGATLRDLPQNELAQWLGEDNTLNREGWPRSLQGVDLVITGEGFSEPAGTLGSLRIATARGEINVISRAEGRVVLAEAATGRAVDLAPQLAGKAALENVGRDLGMSVLKYLDTTAPPREDPGLEGR